MTLNWADQKYMFIIPALLAIFAWQAIVSFDLSAEPVKSAPTNSAGGALQTNFALDVGDVQVNLPDDMAEEDTLTGTVIVTPKGKSDAAKENKRKQIEECTLEINDKPFPIQGKQVCISLPRGEPVLKLVFRNELGRPIYSARLPVNPPAPPCPTSEPTESDYVLPACGVAAGPEQCTGRFDGRFSNTNVSIDGVNRFKYCESPRKVVFYTPNNLVGPASIKLQEGQCTKSGKYNNLQVSIEVAYPSIYTGQATPVKVKVDGLLGLKKTIKLKITHGNTGVFSLVGGNTQVIDVPTDNSSFETTLTAKAVNAGRTNFRASVVF